MRRMRPSESKNVAISWKFPVTLMGTGHLRVELVRDRIAGLDGHDLEPGLLRPLLEELEEILDPLLLRQLRERLAQLLLEELLLAPEESGRTSALPRRS